MPDVTAALSEFAVRGFIGVAVWLLAWTVFLKVSR